MSLKKNCHFCLFLLFIGFIPFKTMIYTGMAVSCFCLVSVSRCLPKTRHRATKKTPPCLVLSGLKAPSLLGFSEGKTKRQTRQLIWVSPEKGMQGGQI